MCDDEAESSTRVLDQIKTLNDMICCAFGNVYHFWSGISEKWSLEETKKCHAPLGTRMIDINAKCKKNGMIMRQVVNNSQLDKLH